MTDRIPLFTLTPDPDTSHRPAAPDPLADYVRDRLPGRLRALHSGTIPYTVLLDEQAALLDEITPRLLAESESESESGAGAGAGDDPHGPAAHQLDLLFLLGGHTPYTPPGRAPAAVPGRLLALIHEQARRHPALDTDLSYELLIDLNCRLYEAGHGIRVFSDGPDARHERDFYLGHHRAEPHVRAAADLLRSLALDPSPEHAPAVLAEATRRLADFRAHMTRYRRLPTRSFAYFRRHLHGYAGRGGSASGSFMPGVQLLELALLRPGPAYERFLDEALPRFPYPSRSVITVWRESSRNGVNVADRVAAGQLGPAARRALLLLLDQFIGFRRAHLGIARRQLPDAFVPPPASPPALPPALSSGSGHPAGDPTDPTVGTGGYTITSFLDASVRRLLDLRRVLLDVPPHMAVRPLPTSERSRYGAGRGGRTGTDEGRSGTGPGVRGRA
ncbi:hypothetical protein I3J09_29585 (plasmid) [Streptomyces clavuligerus]|uniref:Uncharacterized protein n=1 Tax=Streptomyces clavuligerus TaxID=1901 RepID=B5GN80_STRCL|nr:hypothetical protein [Streptomyces clavuligerus]ANW22177.1 hypothetical protein BB341_27965 [Streptomyces clavuligerus]AXU17068.1 hypothetical protein D1794_31020 [Streptomyces clavuligerus]EDY47776.1 hypothetical protein SSCG_00804 [Streptomyces clavuligerus]EFG04235.1 Hypothetical protein SCLAV_p0748 [Streptomyces clavuligerus]MBY6307288.1 hypothetical protein [Streptomyces clavuligerus]